MHLGHISYGIAPSKRGVGYGKVLIYLILGKCLELGISNVLVCARSDNYASNKVIEFAYGSLIDEIYVERELGFVKRYWINTKYVLENLRSRGRK